MITFHFVIIWRADSERPKQQILNARNSFCLLETVGIHTCFQRRMAINETIFSAKHSNREFINECNLIADRGYSIYLAYDAQS